MTQKTVTFTFSRVAGCTFILARWRRQTLYHGPLVGVASLPTQLRDPIQRNLETDAAKWAIRVMEERL